MIYGIQVTPAREPKVINGCQLYEFVISHSETLTEYRLATTLEERDKWIEQITQIVNGEHISPTICSEEEGIPSEESDTSPPTDFGEQSSQPIPSLDSNSPHEPMNRHLVDFGVPIPLKEKIDSICRTILEYSQPEFTQDWPVMYEKDGVKGCRRPGSGLICVRGEILLPYSIPEIFTLALNPKMKKIVDPNIDRYERGKWYNFHTGQEYTKSKGSWPTSPRDFSNGTHWRLLRSGKFMNFAFHEENDLEFPEQPGVVRAKVFFGGYVMQHVVGGTHMMFLLQVDIGGSVPLAIANFVGQSKPLTLAAIRKVLDEQYGGGKKPRPDFSSPSPPTYEGFTSLASPPAQKFTFRTSSGGLSEWCDASGG